MAWLTRSPGGGHRQLVGVAGRVGHRGDIGGGVVPADGQDVGVPGGLRPGVGDRHRRLIGLRHRGIHLHKSRRSATALATVTVTGAEVVVLPAASRARAVSVWVPFVAVVVFHVRL